MASQPGRRNDSSSLRRALTLLEELARCQQSGSRWTSLTELTRQTGLPRSTVYRLLTPLMDHGLVESSPDGYSLGPQAAVLGGTYLEGIDLRADARPHLERLGNETGENGHLVIPAGTEIIYVDKVEAPAALRMHTRIGGRNPMHSTGVGKAILAFSPEALLAEVIATGLPPKTPRTITDPAALRTELAQIRERGHSVDNIENEPGIRCVAAAVFDAAGTPVAALSVSGPASRITSARVPRVAALVMAEASQLSAALGAPMPAAPMEGTQPHGEH